VALVKSDLAVDIRGRPAVSSFAVGPAVRQLGGSGDDPVGAGVIEAQSDQPAQIERGDAVVQPRVVLGGSAVAQFAVATHDPSDAPLDHRPVLSVNRLEFRCFGLPTGSK
jgi:hypothetical protein